ncbi:MFS transporter [Amycolatopsis suaedae]|uniref:MFS transporter n=2 Tax=Amycolatopsis suaedae TaxID=2510978 RepID=A0A4Q7J5A8_9PSEU|nr:MFS transporter [Amycolatopsis suaedae]
MSRANARWRWGLYALAFTMGMSIASWVTRTPAIRDAVSASTSEMGIVLFGLSAGSMIGILAAGVWVHRVGIRPLLVTGTGLLVLGLAVVATGVLLALGAGVFAGLFLFGLGMGAAEVALNVSGAVYETTTGHTNMTLLHGMYSLGTLIGALLGFAAVATGLPVAAHIAVMTGLVAVTAVRVIGWIPARSGQAEGKPRWRDQARVWTDRRVVLIGLIVLALALAEGSANDWLPLLMVDGYGLDATAGSVAFTAFAAMMTIGRFTGTPLLRRFGRALVLRVAIAVTAAGLVLMVFAPNAILSGVAVVLWGLGASLGFPVGISAAGEHPDNPAARVSAVATAGYVALLAGPPALGFLGEEFGLRTAMLLVLVLVSAAALCTGALRPVRSSEELQTTR